VTVAGPPQLLYLEPDDEITTVVRRLRETSAEHIVLVASGRTKATSSAVALRLLAGVAADEGRQIALVADAAARAMAAEAGIDTFASVAEASADGAVPLAPPEPRRAPIRVVRDADPARPLAAVVSSAPGLDETQAVPVSRPALGEALEARRARSRRFAIGVAAALLVIALAGVAAVAPAAVVRVTAATRAVGPETYEITLPVQRPDIIDIEVTETGAATGSQEELVAASGTVTFLNWGGAQPTVPAGTVVSVAGEPEFATQAAVSVPPAEFLPDGTVRAGEASVEVRAVAAGPSGNVAAEAIDTVENSTITLILRGLPNNPRRIVINVQATTGGAQIDHPMVIQEDVDAVVAAIREEIDRRVAVETAADPTRHYPPTEVPEPTIDIAEDLVGRLDQESFELTGTLAFERSYVEVAEVEATARQRALADASLIPAGMELQPASLDLAQGEPELDGDRIRVPVRVTAQAVARLDATAIRSSVLGLTAEEAEAALDGVGAADVELWPGWVDRIPRLDWRVTVEIAGESPSP
jgi:hypothetical protein